MDVKYIKETNQLQFGHDDKIICIVSIGQVIEAIPTEDARIHELLNKINVVRTKKIKMIDSFGDRIIELTVEIAKYRKILADLIETGKYDATTVKAYSELIKACLAEKNTLNEFRHATKLLGLEEGRLMEILDKLEITSA